MRETYTYTYRTGFENIKPPKARHTRQDKPYPLGTAETQVVETRHRCCCWAVASPVVSAIASGVRQTLKNSSLLRHTQRSKISLSSEQLFFPPINPELARNLRHKTKTRCERSEASLSKKSKPKLHSTAHFFYEFESYFSERPSSLEHHTQDKTSLNYPLAATTT